MSTNYVTFSYWREKETMLYNTLMKDNYTIAKKKVSNNFSIKYTGNMKTDELCLLKEQHCGERVQKWNRLFNNINIPELVKTPTRYLY